ncbi:uncharacterized protein LOC131950379 [Physella acuta]|uniref:uncharacterized protein LOC131950379 n=1 Tax=Physella acuta TaxID=109671 RepID=UPI0027DB7A2B|nr:uncharacterized protein LOC131950379 [Physella acuta]
MYNGATRTSDPLTVQIITLKPTITSQPSVKGNFYGAGVNYVLWCNTDSGVTAGWTYTWIKDKIDMQINSDTYEITQASAAIHDGVYTCISTYSGVSTSSDALTVIIVAATLAMNDTNGQISADKAFNVSEDGPKLTCAVTRQLPNANTLVYTFRDDVSVLQQGSSVNYIIDTSVPSNTTYRCSVTYDWFTTFSQTSARIAVTMKPYISIRPISSFYGAGNNYVLKCNTDSRVINGWTFSWIKNNTDLHNNADVYSITNATATLHDGVYTCTSTYNRVASTSDAVTVTIIAAVMTISDVGGPILTDTTYNVGSAGPTLTCTTTPPLANASTVTYTFRNDTASIHASYSETYTLNGNLPSSSTYKCGVTYDRSTVYSPTSAIITFSNNFIAVPTIIKTSPGDLALGFTFSLTCGDATLNADFYQWFFDETLIENLSTKELQRAPFTEADIGVFKCRAIKSRYRTANATFTAVMKPTLNRQTLGSFYGAGGNYVLKCNSGSNALIGWSYAWAKESRDLNIHADNYQITNATAATYDGTYTCTSTYNRVSSISNNLTVIVVAATLIVEDSHGPISIDTTYNVGAEGPTLTCGTTSQLPSENTVTYTFMNDTSSIDEGPSDTYTLNKNVPSNSTYSCSVTYDLSTTYSSQSPRIAFSNNFISDPSIMKVSPGDITLGSNLTLSCGDTTIHAEFYQWFFDETMIENQSNKRLERSRFTERDIGVYKCRAVKSRYTTANATFTAGIKPQIIREPSGSFYGAGGTYILRCSTYSSLSTGWSYSWTKNSNVISGSATQSYTITNASAAIHNGVYSCTTTYNGVSSTSDNLPISIISATLIVTDPLGHLTTDTTYNVGVDGPNLTCTTTPELENINSSKHMRYEFWNGQISLQDGISNTYTIDTATEHSATYNCSVTYDGTTTYSLPSSNISFRNKYIPDPVIYKQNPDELSIGSTLVLSCGDETTVADIFQWTIKDKVPQNQQSQTFRVDNFSLDDIGVYKCCVVKSRYITAEASFVAIMKPSITRVPSGTFYGAGCDYTLLCNSGSSETVGWTYLWTKNSVNTTTQTASYILHNASSSTHDGVFTCTSAYNGVSSTSDSLNITIVEAILVVTDSTGPVTTDTVYNVGSDGPTLTCTTTHVLADFNIEIPPVYEFSVCDL